ncbi:FtsK/SpoIIIE domain-containing protein [Streptomyces sp. TRM68367]|uniref:FtsK/SpoIIIE domain-containing protein n=1 Tax=Streptomyces sp. TRM68367 TaxID=2758415 RepID=UPI0029350C80|nr:FtsK/SpoIIIE domain-containing protein [Streptomyces sp. TRM68367]
MTDLVTWAELGGSLAAMGGAAYARHAHPAAYWSTVGLPVSVVRLLASYTSTMEACGLTVEPRRWRALALKATTRREVRPVPPCRGMIRPTSTGLRLRLRLAPGQEPADVAASAERLRHAWGVHAVYVRDVKPGVVELRLVGFDVLRKVRMPRRTDAGPLRVPVALREDAIAFVRDYRAVPHELVLGATLSGKFMFLRNLLVGLAAQPVVLVGIDCKRGVELAPFAPRLSALATDPEQAAELLPVLVKEMEDRYDVIKARQGIAPGTPDELITSDVWGLPEDERPAPIVLFIDEVAELFLVATRKEEERRDVATAGLLDLENVPAWLRILVAGWPAVAFLGGTLLAHGSANPSADPVAAAEPRSTAQASEPTAEEVELPSAAPELPATASESAPPPPSVPPALVTLARKVADEHRARTGTDIDTSTLRARLGVPMPLAEAITTQLT